MLLEEALDRIHESKDTRKIRIEWPIELAQYFPLVNTHDIIEFIRLFRNTFVYSYEYTDTEIIIQAYTKKIKED